MLFKYDSILQYKQQLHDKQKNEWNHELFQELKQYNQKAYKMWILYLWLRATQKLCPFKHIGYISYTTSTEMQVKNVHIYYYIYTSNHFINIQKLLSQVNIISKNLITQYNDICAKTAYSPPLDDSKKTIPLQFIPNIVRLLYCFVCNQAENPFKSNASFVNCISCQQLCHKNHLIPYNHYFIDESGLYQCHNCREGLQATEIIKNTPIYNILTGNQITTQFLAQFKFR